MLKAIEKAGYRPFNRTILECKFTREGRTVYAWVTFNRTILECKFVILLELHNISLSFNRTILECKCLSSYQIELS